MSTINTQTILPTTGMSPGDTGPTRAPKSVLDQGDFLKLLTVQLSKQDPLKPVEDQAFIAQMAQFSSLEQMNALTQEFAVLRADQQMISAGAMIGREVTVDDGESYISGVVEAVESYSGRVQVVVNGLTYDLSAVQRVALPPPPVESTVS